MEKLNLPICEIKLRRNQQKVEVFDIIRKKYILLTSEEWVRQHFVHYLINYLKYPKSLISLESGLKYNQLNKRSDIVIYDRKGQPFMLIECKAPSVTLTQAVFHQAACYNSVIKAKYMVATNGIIHYCCSIDQKNGTTQFQENLPVYSEPEV